jgi:hypothetical protein
VITLLLIPSFYYIAEDMKTKMSGLMYVIFGMKIKGTIYEASKNKVE